MAEEFGITYFTMFAPTNVVRSKPNLVKVYRGGI